MSDSAVPGLERGLNILRLFKRNRATIAPPEMARELAIPRSTVHRLVQTLETMGFLRRVEHGGAYTLGPAVLTLGFDYLGSLGIVELAEPVLAALRDATNCSTHLAQRNGRDIVYLSRFPSRAAVTSNIGVGSSLPAHATVIGRVILADLSEAELQALYGRGPLPRFTAQTPPDLAALKALLDEDRRRGYAVSASFYEPGIVSVAAPVRDRTGRAVASINAVSVEPAAGAPEVQQQLVPRVLAAAAEISAMLGAAELAEAS